jgi:hypothetical protein
LPLIVITALLALAAVGIYQYSRLRRRTEYPLPEGAAPLAADHLVWHHVRAQGRLTLVLVGTYGVNQGWRLVEQFVRAGCSVDIGAIVVLELDERQRTRFLGDLAALAPELLGRTTVCRSSLLPAGLQNSPYEEVNSPYLRCYWQPPIAAALDEACLLIRGTDQVVYDPAPAREPYQQGFDPATILLVASPGGHTAVGVFAGEVLRKNFPLAPIYAMTVVPADGQMREEFSTGLDHYQRAGFVSFFLVSDNQRADIQANDRAAAIALAGLWVAPLLADAADEPWNLLRRLYPRKDGGVVTSRQWARTLPVRRTPGPTPRYFTFEDAVIRAVLDGLAGIEAEETKGVLLPTPAPQTSRYVVIAAPLEATALVRVRDKVEAALHHTGWFGADHLRHLVWAAVAETLTLTTTGAQLSVVMLEAAVDGPKTLRTLVRPTSSLPGPARPDAPRGDGAAAPLSQALEGASAEVPQATRTA